ncbi:AAA family ATPase [Streptomyces netropsis]|uniref:Nuclease SbcCD subunit C n=1 Tax=Streptomyces netropsis TaxID=55404 RepID=A0A7W7PHM6_STRNE|nr:SMC family ATPase [Streptomyces netropsis]MBB4888905.1 exonuclease SbcC [Streptomyces netropsis]GGR11506.1 nuclease SbcCD subunit C [Streptomyces netropsis]
MRLHRLAVTAFGPFGATQHIDFDELSAAGLFLLHGPTGAGKTSILDAVCYALYGGVPGARQGSGPTLRSDHAEPGTPTEVTLDLTVGGRRLEITRRPEQPRPKKRGTGVTREKAYSALREHKDGHWQGLSRSHQEIGEEIKQLLGMSQEQFCQVVLLPQGDFARFLRAEDAARGKLLGKLFDTGRFAAVEAHLAELRRAAEKQVTAGDERLLALGHRMRQAAADPSLPEVGTPAPATVAPSGTRPSRAASVPAQRAAEPPLAPGAPGLAEAVLEWAALARANARERRDIAAAAAKAADAAHHAAREEADAVRERDHLQRRHADARQRALALEERREETRRIRERLDRARAAESVAPVLDLRERAGRAHRDAVAAEARARRELPAEHTDGGAEALAALERRLREELGSLAGARRAEQRAADIAAERAGLERDARLDEDILTDTADWFAGWEARRAAHEQRVETAREAATRAARLEGELAAARQRLGAAVERDRLTGQVEDAEERLRGARERANEAREHWLDLKERRLLGFAAELAAELGPGAACKVCGSTEHPDPARTAADHVDRTDEERALETSRRADAAREETDRRLHTLREALAAATAGAGTATVAELTAAFEDVLRSFTEARDAGADAHAAREARDRAAREYELRREERQAAQLRSSARTAHRERLDAQLVALEEELTQARGGAATVAQRAALLERQLARLAEAAEAVRAAQDAATRLQEADVRLADAAHRAGFDTPRSAAAAILTGAEQRELQHRLDRWQREETEVAAQLADPAAAAAAALPPADPRAAQEAADTASRALQRAFAEDAAARTRCEDLDRLSAQATADAHRLAPLREEHHRVASLASLAAGTSADNERKMRLESYVLAARLEQVAAAATARLQRMSAGRYTLVHSDQRTGGTRRSGLGLHVIDSWTGSERDTATLSGGETFFASLSLALGLADVVTDEAGGMRLDTLFIDEGFGSLDEQTLDEVLDVLDSLRERDRTVGIVSHVADLRQRVPAQLQVVKDRSGSAVRHRTAGVSG